MAKRILLVNDDGIYADSFKATVEAFKNLGYDITICAPLRQQSAKSHAIEIVNAFSIEEVDAYEGIKAYAIDSTPADCVRVAKYYLKWEGDIVVSGINNGLNMGDDIHYSGTCAAAIEAGIRGYKALALSAPHGNPEIGAKKVKEIMQFVEENKLFDKWNVWNFNVPFNADKFKLTRQGDTCFDTYFDEVKAGVLLQRGNHHYELDKDTESDVYNSERGYIVYSPLSCDKTYVKMSSK